MGSRISQSARSSQSLVPDELNNTRYPNKPSKTNLQITANECETIRRSWNQIQNHLRLCSHIFQRIFSRSTQILEAVNGKKVEDINEAMKSPAVAAHVNRFHTFLSQVILKLDNDQTGVLQIYRNVALNHSPVSSGPLSQRNFQIFIDSIIDCLIEELEQENLGYQDFETIRSAWKTFLAEMVCEMREIIFRDHYRRDQRRISENNLHRVESTHKPLNNTSSSLI